MIKTSVAKAPRHAAKAEGQSTLSDDSYCSAAHQASMASPVDQIKPQIVQLQPMVNAPAAVTLTEKHAFLEPNTNYAIMSKSNAN